MRFEDLPSSITIFRHGISCFNEWMREVTVNRAITQEWDPLFENWRSPLTGLGMTQSTQLGHWLRSEDSDIPSFTRQITSPLARARESAGIVSMMLNDEDDYLKYWEISHLVRERNFGLVNSVRNEQDLELYLTSLEQRRINPVSWCPPGGEDVFRLYERAEIQIGLSSPRISDDDEHHLYSSHGWFMWGLRGVVEGIEPEALLAMYMDPAQYIGACDALQYRRTNAGLYQRRICRFENLPRKGEGWQDIERSERTHFQLLSQVGKLLPD